MTDPIRRRILLVPDSFKGALTASGVCGALRLGFRRVVPQWDIVSRPMADEGEG